MDTLELRRMFLIQSYFVIQFGYILFDVHNWCLLKRNCCVLPIYRFVDSNTRSRWTIVGLAKYRYFKKKFKSVLLSYLVRLWDVGHAENFSATLIKVISSVNNIFITIFSRFFILITEISFLS